MSAIKNHFTAKVTAMAQVTGNASDNDVSGHLFVLACEATLKSCRFSCSTMASSKTAKISLYADTTKVVDQTDLVSTALNAKGTLTAAKVDTIFPVGTVFKMKEESTASSNVDGLAADLMFVQMSAIP